jgi:hypothetical protein
VIGILSPLPVWRRTQVGAINRTPIVHGDAVRLHTVRITLVFLHGDAMERVPRPPSSSILAHSDFAFVGHVKGLFPGRELPDRTEFVQEVPNPVAVWERCNANDIELGQSPVTITVGDLSNCARIHSCAMEIVAVVLDFRSL